MVGIVSTVNGLSFVVIIVKMTFGKSMQEKSLPLRREQSVKKHRSMTLRKQDIIQAMVMVGINGILKLTQADK